VRAVLLVFRSTEPGKSLNRLGFLKGAIVGAFVLAVSAGGAHAQQLLGEKLYADHVGGIEPGIYSAGDNLRFTLDPYGDNYLLRITDQPEVFVLHADRASLGGRVLKFDSGTTALQVSGWGALTLYTDDQPAGLPAVREADSTPPVLPQVSLPDMQTAAQDESQHLGYSHQLHVSFLADWNVLANDANGRALLFDAMQNTTRGFDRFAARGDGRSAVMQKISSVKLMIGKSSSVLLSGRTLMVSIDPSRGYAGRFSSRAVAQSLARLLSVRQAANE
jgi:hypothetical protein